MKETKMRQGKWLDVSLGSCCILMYYRCFLFVSQGQNHEKLFIVEAQREIVSKIYDFEISLNCFRQKQ